jgi:hypothetical protein
MVIAAEVGRERVAEGLTRRGFASTEVDGVTVWHRGEDGRASLLGYVADDPFALLRDGLDAPARDAAVLPPFGLAVLVDLQDGPDQVTLIALLYPDADAAAAAAEVLAGRLTRFVDETIPTWGARVEPPRVYGGEDGLAAAVAAIRSPPHGAAEAPGHAYARWLQAVARREFE